MSSRQNSDFGSTTNFPFLDIDTLEASGERSPRELRAAILYLDEARSTLDTARERLAGDDEAQATTMSAQLEALDRLLVERRERLTSEILALITRFANALTSASSALSDAIERETENTAADAKSIKKASQKLQQTNERARGLVKSLRVADRTHEKDIVTAVEPLEREIEATAPLLDRANDRYRLVCVRGEYMRPIESHLDENEQLLATIENRGLRSLQQADEEANELKVCI